MSATWMCICRQGRPGSQTTCAKALGRGPSAAWRSHRAGEGKQEEMRGARTLVPLPPGEMGAMGILSRGVG